VQARCKSNGARHVRSKRKLTGDRYQTHFAFPLMLLNKSSARSITKVLRRYEPQNASGAVVSQEP
jgi:hypothetical protein